MRIKEFVRKMEKQRDQEWQVRCFNRILKDFPVLIGGIIFDQGEPFAPATTWPHIYVRNATLETVLEASYGRVTLYWIEQQNSSFRMRKAPAVDRTRGELLSTLLEGNEQRFWKVRELAVVYHSGVMGGYSVTILRPKDGVDMISIIQGVQ